MKRPARLTLASSLALTTLGAAVGTDALQGGTVVTAVSSASPDSVPFGVGERMVYNARYGPMNVGEGSMEVLAFDSIRGIEAWHTRFQLTGGLAFYRADFKLESWFDVAGFNSLRFINDSEQGGRTRERRYEIFPDRQRYQQDELPETTSVANPLDEGALLYYVRTMDLEVGQTYELHRYFRPDRNPVVLKVIKRETITVPTGTYNTIVVQPIIKTRGIFSEGGQALIWLSDDKYRVPVQLRVRLRIGSISLQLKSYTPPKNATPDTTGQQTG
ncbi:MAG TPA: DUF3108 domain-containing protein [Gemmatimonadaceae bacterium]